MNYLCGEIPRINYSSSTYYEHLAHNSFTAIDFVLSNKIKEKKNVNFFNDTMAALVFTHLIQLTSCVYILINANIGNSLQKRRLTDRNVIISMLYNEWGNTGLSMKHSTFSLSYFFSYITFTCNAIGLLHYNVTAVIVSLLAFFCRSFYWSKSE